MRAKANGSAIATKRMISPQLVGLGISMSISSAISYSPWRVAFHSPRESTNLGYVWWFKWLPRLIMLGLFPSLEPPKKKVGNHRLPQTAGFWRSKSITLFALKTLASHQIETVVPYHDSVPCAGRIHLRVGLKQEKTQPGTPFLQPVPTHCKDHISSWLLSHLSQKVPKIGFSKNYKSATVPNALLHHVLRLHASPDTKAARAQQDEAMLFGDPYECQWNLQHGFFPSTSQYPGPNKKNQRGQACPCWSSMRVQPQAELHVKFKKRGGGVQKTQETCKFQIQESAGRGDSSLKSSPWTYVKWNLLYWGYPKFNKQTISLYCWIKSIQCL